MYDSYISPDKYNELKDRVEQWINDGGSSDEYDGLVDAIDDSYGSEEISSSNYDRLMNMLEDYQ